MEERIKYPRTPHLPWSLGATGDDRWALEECLANLRRGEVVVTEKMDGENTTFYRDGLHARSLESTRHPTRAFVQGLQAKVGYSIPEGFRICGENVYARHSISYRGLPGYFLVFSAWDRDTCLSWHETEEWAELLDLPVVPVLYRGPWNETAIRALYHEPREKEREGYVVRAAGSFELWEFGLSMAKFVRSGHVETDEHWLRQAIVPNALKAT